MNEHVSIENVPKKLESYQKNYEFVTSKTKICLFYLSFIFFMKLILNFQLIIFISQVILSENLNEKKMM